jgi:hypothetical protein
MQERNTYLAVAPDLGPLLRTLLRLRDDFVMIGRIAVTPLPAAVQARLEPVLASVGHTTAAYLRASATALVARQQVAPCHAVDAALDDYAAEMAVLSRRDLPRDLSVDAVEVIFTLAFALEQLRRNVNDLERHIAEIANSRIRKY